MEKREKKKQLEEVHASIVMYTYTNTQNIYFK